MAYLTEEELKKLGFKHVGKNVKISDRAAIYNCDQISIGDNSRIDDFCVLSGKIEIGRNVHITPQCLIHGSIGGVVMQDFSVLAYGVKVFTSSDDYTDGYMTNSTVPSEFKKVSEKSVLIKKHVIVGTNAIIMPGVVLETGCSVGAGSVVICNTEEFGVYVGTPAKFIKKRGNKLLELEKEYLDKYDI